MKPDVWRIRSRIVIGRAAGTRSNLPSRSTPTVIEANAGRYLATGSESSSRPSSTSVIVATETIGLVIE